MITKKLYTTQARSTGGRQGEITTKNGAIHLKLDMQNKGEGTNPEQLFAAGYAACFESTLQVMGERQGVKVGESSVNGLVDFGMTDEGGYEIAVKLEVSLPDLNYEQAKKLIELAHENCPYSKATKDNIKVEIIEV